MSTLSTTSQTTERSTNVNGTLLYYTGLLLGKLTRLTMSFVSEVKANPVTSTISIPLPKAQKSKVVQPRKWSMSEIESIPTVLRKTGQSAEAWLAQKTFDDEENERQLLRYEEEARSHFEGEFLPPDVLIGEGKKND